jgi:ABC-2 type transport system permease protein
MVLLLSRKLFCDTVPSLAVVCLLVVAFSALWVKIAQRVTTELAPFFNGLAVMNQVNPKLMDEVIFKGPGKVAQSVMGGSDVRFERPTDFLAVEMLHPVILTLTGMWVVGRAAGAVAGELDRGTMELLLSQPVPRGRLILAHLFVDLAAIPCICLGVVAGTQLGLWLVGPFAVDYSILQKLTADSPLKFRPPQGPAVLEVNADRQIFGSMNHAALLFAFSGLAMLVSSFGRNRWRSTGYAVVIFVGMFVLNLVGQIWDTIGAARPLSLFFYYQPQKIWLAGDWWVKLAEVWPGGPSVPVVPVLLAVGLAGYAAAYRVFTKRDLPAPL